MVLIKWAARESMMALFVAATAIGLSACTGMSKSSRMGMPALPPELEELRAAMERYQNPVKAVHDGYFSTLGCVEFPDGGMGVHFLNTALISPVPDPLRPQILLYEQEADRLRLVALEWFIPLATGINERPNLFGQPFDGPMEGHYPLMPKDLVHYDLHVWLFKTNPTGIFNKTNPMLKCPRNGAYSLMVEPPRLVPHE